MGSAPPVAVFDCPRSARALRAGVGDFRHLRHVDAVGAAGADWTITNATPPKRVDKPGAAADDATAALGDGTLTLKFVLSRLDANVGKRVSVSGILIGAGGANGINVSQVSKVADTCP